MLALAALVVAGWVVFAAVSALRAGTDLRAAERAVDAARDKSSTSELANGRPIPDLREAQSRFQRAADRTSHPLLLPVHPLPVIGRQLRSVRDLSKAAATISGAGGDALEEVSALLSTADFGPADRAPLVRKLSDLASRTDQRLEGISLGPHRGLIGPLAEAHDELADQLTELRAGLRNGTQAATAVADLLAGPRRYLVLAANNAEMRAGSGMLLSAGELESEGGRLRLGELQTVSDIPVPPGVPLPADLADRWGWLNPNEDWTSLMLSPRFDAMAPVAAQMWVASGHRPVDGVLVVDPVTLSAFLTATGPVTVGDREVNADNVVEELLHSQYFRFSNDDKVARRDDLGRIARAAFEAFDTGGWSPSRLAGSLVSAARGRHLMLWSARPAEQAGWVAAGVHGGLRPESLMVAVQNRAGTKSDQFLTVAARLDLRPDGDGKEATLTLDLRNVIPRDQPSYISGPHPGSGVGKDEYLGIVALSLPGLAENGRFDGVQSLAVAGPDGPTRVIGFQASLAAGEQRSVVARFRLPGSHGEVHIEPTARIPGVKWTYGEKQWEDGRRHVVQW
ncbi:MAG: DUF4012 domain-containing protein [Actinomycetota bacterium]|nr:DUF4012 domain-containing protein [Actinomycetota bacterium]